MESNLAALLTKIDVSLNRKSRPTSIYIPSRLRKLQKRADGFLTQEFVVTGTRKLRPPFFSQSSAAR